MLNLEMMMKKKINMKKIKYLFQKKLLKKILVKNSLNTYYTEKHLKK